MAKNTALYCICMMAFVFFLTQQKPELAKTPCVIKQMPNNGFTRMHLNNPTMHHCTLENLCLSRLLKINVTEVQHRASSSLKLTMAQKNQTRQRDGALNNTLNLVLSSWPFLRDFLGQQVGQRLQGFSCRIPTVSHSYDSIKFHVWQHV